ncbi:MAG TPA: hypothetical protein VFD73_05025, partial [Gemmatimonadales bacterium]|nr:hypothetical protein [Gemmatimonadales bacterium]
MEGQAGAMESLAVRWSAAIACLVLSIIAGAALVGPSASKASAWAQQSTVDPEPLPPESRLNAVSCPTTTFCAAFGHDDGGVKELFHLWNGTEWKVGSSETPNELPADASCGSTTSCIVVGTDSAGAARAERWSAPAEGKPWGWTALTVPKPAESQELVLSSVSCTSASACTAVGSYFDKTGRKLTLAERWNGTSWSIQTTANPASGNAELFGVSCTSSTSCTAVGKQVSGTLAERWNGSTWSISTTPNPTGTGIRLREVSCPTTSFCLAIGMYGALQKTLAETWNGSAWTLVSSPNPTETGSTYLTDVSCPTTESCAATGYYFVGGGETRTLIERWNGSALSLQSSPNPEGKAVAQLSDVSCASASICASVGFSQTTTTGPAAGTLGERWNGSAWSIQSTVNPEPLPPESRLTAVSCSTSSFCAAFGYDTSREKELFRVWNGTEWKVASVWSGETLNRSPADASCSSTTYCIVVGSTPTGEVKSE